MSKRGQNEGSIFKRKDGRWVAIANLGYRDGKRRRKYVYGKTRREVQEQLTSTLRDIDQGRPVATERQTLGQFLEYWLRTYVATKLRPSTQSSYKNHVSNHFEPALGRHPLNKLSPQHVQNYLQQKTEEGLSARTIQYHRATLRCALNCALRWGLVSRNAAALTESPRVRKYQSDILDPAQARALLDAVKGNRLEALYSVAIALGLLQGEALGLRWEDIDSDRGELRVRHALQRVDGKLQLVEPKSKHSERAINLPGVAIAALRRHRSRQLQERLAAGSRWNESDFVFTTTIGTPLDGPRVTRNFQRMLRVMGFPRLRFHDLRHTCASLLLAQGEHPRVVMETLGHSQISLTMDTYSHVLPALKKEAANKMDAILSGSGSR